MRAARLHGYDTTLEGAACSLREDMPDLKISAPDEVIVTIDGAGVCRTDLDSIEGQCTGFQSHSLIHSWARERRFRRRGWSRGATLPPWQPSHHLSTDHRWHLLRLLAWPRQARRGRRRSGSYAGRGIGRISCDEGAELRVETTRVATAFRVASCRCRADWLPCGQAGTLLVRSGRHRRAHRLRWARAERVSDRARAGPEHRGRSIGADTRSCPGTRARCTERADRELVENVRQTTGGQGTAVILDCVGEGSTP